MNSIKMPVIFFNRQTQVHMKNCYNKSQETKGESNVERPPLPHIKSYYNLKSNLNNVILMHDYTFYGTV